MAPDFDLTLHPASRLIDEITTLASKAAEAIRSIGAASRAERTKPDGTPVTAADEAAQAVVLDGLARLLPGIPVVAEEMSRAERPKTLAPRFVLVDPLDGTREYVAGRDEFTVNIALMVQGRPVFGCIAAPLLGLIWRGVVGQGAERLVLPPGADAAQCRDRIPIRTRSWPASEPVALVSRSHLDAQTEAFLDRIPNVKRIACGSSLKFCKLAEGSADIYPRLARTSEWDVAAGHALLVAAGGTVVTPDGIAPIYGESADFRVPSFVAFADASVTRRILRP
jgi:3'(2'), 5'-bisphosphate nucleotidase